MNVDAVKAWIYALRSAKGKPAIGVMSSSDGRFCAMGIACEAAIAARVPITKCAINRGGVCYSYDRFLAAPPPRVIVWLGLSCNQIDCVTRLNDAGASFRLIADILESFSGAEGRECVRDASRI